MKYMRSKQWMLRNGPGDVLAGQMSGDRKAGTFQAHAYRLDKRYITI